MSKVSKNANKNISSLQTASTGILSLGQHHTKCVKTFGTPPCNITSTNILKLVKLAWLDRRTVVLIMDCWWNGEQIQGLGELGIDGIAAISKGTGTDIIFLSTKIKGRF
jgi:Tat protein secretion system quality control protein TatD with DNase activity